MPQYTRELIGCLWHTCFEALRFSPGKLFDSPSKVSNRLLKFDIIPGSQSSPNVVNPDSSLQLDEIKIGEWYEGTVVRVVSSFF